MYSSYQLSWCFFFFFDHLKNYAHVNDIIASSVTQSCREIIQRLGILGLPQYYENKISP